ncbi:MAG TPA: YDG/SRA domain-containing protein [Acidobacteriaceae bacterium]|nr:YDG/SRA domain-containing protein [Acidobacteriaceae bacterium]
MKRDDIISHHDMCGRESMSLQRGMNFRTAGGHAVVLSSLRPGAPYDDRLEENGSVLIYEGHDESRSKKCPNPKAVDQPLETQWGRLTQNGLFHEAAQEFKSGNRDALRVRVYEKIKAGIWVYNGVFALEDSWMETIGGRRVFKFKLRLLEDLEEQELELDALRAAEEHARLIPSAVKLAVWKRDLGQCVRCGSKENLHFDHILPYSKGGTSTSEKNIQLLCMKHNLQKHAHIQ